MDELKIKGNLTPSYISASLSPFLNALSSLQHTIDEIKHGPRSSVSINHISSDKLTEEEKNWEQKAAITTSWDAWEDAKQALLGLRETIETINEEPLTSSIQKAKLRQADAYFQLVRALVGDEPRWERSQALRRTRTVFRSNFLDYAYDEAVANALASSSEILVILGADTLDELSKTVEKDDETAHMIGVFRSKEE